MCVSESVWADYHLGEILMSRHGSCRWRTMSLTFCPLRSLLEETSRKNDCPEAPASLKFRLSEGDFIYNLSP